MTAQQTVETTLLMENERLKQKLLSFSNESGRFNTAIEGLLITRFNKPHDNDSCFYTPSIGLIVQGEKQSIIGEKTINCSACQCLVNGVDMPSISKVYDVSADNPFLAVSLSIDRELASAISVSLNETTTQTQHDDYLSVSVSNSGIELVDAFIRLVALLETPDYIPTLAPLIIQEIHYYILTGPQADLLKKVVTTGSQSNQVAEAISWLRNNFTRAVSMEALAKRVQMKPTNFHRHFKLVTSMSPLQFQKSLRLYEAQRIMLVEGKDANSASFAVGYESPNQFNRDYKKMFGEPPLRNIQKLRLA